MSFEGKKKRLSALGRVPLVAGTDHRHQLDKNGKHFLLSKLPRNKRRKLAAEGKRIAKKYNDILLEIRNTGAGFPVDKLLRDLVIEYNHRYASSGIYNQPVSFNYFEPFSHLGLIKNSSAPYVEPIDEVDHLFNITDYFDYITSDASDGFDLSSLLEIPEDKTLHFTTNGDVLDFSYLNAEGRQFVVSGFTMVRRGNSLHWYLLGGEILTEEEWELRSTDQVKIELENINPQKRAFLLESIEENDYKLGPPLSLEGTSTAIRTVIAGEIDLVTKKYLDRCLMIETENSFNITSDSPDVLYTIPDVEKRQDMIDRMKEKISQAAVIWDLVGAMFQLPSYFAYKIKLKKKIVVAADRVPGEFVLKRQPGVETDRRNAFPTRSCLAEQVARHCHR